MTLPDKPRFATLVVLSVALIAAAPVPAQEDATPDPMDVIEAQLAAFNAHDVETLAANVAEDFEWFAVDERGAEMQLRGRGEFLASMEEYFASVPEARASIEAAFPIGRYVAVRESAYWTSRGREVSQSSLAVYEIIGGQIRRVWYYPAVD